MHGIFVVGTAAAGNVALVVHSHYKHIYIVVAAGRGKTYFIKLAVRYISYADDVVENVGRGSVKMCACRSYPIVNVGQTVAGGINDVPAAGAESKPHSAIKNLIIYRLGFVAIVVFKIVHAPFGKRLRIFELMVETCGVAFAGARACA